jgi:hypothetical protein
VSDWISYEAGLIEGYRRVAYSPSAVVWHVGVGRVPEAPAAHHDIHFGEEWARPLRR